MAANAAGEGEFLEELKHPLLILALVRIDLGIRALQIDWRQHARRTVARAGQKNGIEVILVNQAVEVDVSEAQPRTGSPVPQQALFDVLRLQGLAEQRIGAQIDHAASQIIASSPVPINQAELLTRQPAFGTCVVFFRRRLHIGKYTCHESSYIS